MPMTPKPEKWGMRVVDILNQLSATYGQPTPAALDANDHISAAQRWPWIHLKSCFTSLKNAQKQRYWVRILTPINSSS